MRACVHAYVYVCGWLSWVDVVMVRGAAVCATLTATAPHSQGTEYDAVSRGGRERDGGRVAAYKETKGGVGTEQRRKESEWNGKTRGGAAREEGGRGECGGGEQTIEPGVRVGRERAR